MNKKAMFLLLALLTLKIFLPMGMVQATDYANFGVSAIIPDNQVNEQATYFDIEMAPGQEQILEVNIVNSSDKEIKVEVSSNTAATNGNGVLVYDGSETEADKYMAHSFATISEVEEAIVTVPANEQATARIKVQAPEEAFEGEILGGLYFLLVNDEDAANGPTIQNRFAYSIAVNIQSTEAKEEEITPEISFRSIEEADINFLPGLQTTFVNESPILISNVSVQASVSSKGSDELVLERSVTPFMIAPSGQFNFPMTYQDGALPAGEYTFRAVLANADFEWEFTEDFVISEE